MTLVALWDIARWVLPLIGLGIGWWVRDRRKDRAASDVAERTVPAEVALKDIGADEARLVYVQREMDAERAFHRSQLVDRDRQIEWQRTELARRDLEIARRDEVIAHRDQVIAELRAEIEELQRRLSAVRDRLSELTENEETP